MTPAQIDQEVAAGRVVFIGSRTDDPNRRHIEGSTEYPCNECQCPVMLSPATRERMTPTSAVLCTECAAKVAERRNQPWFEAPRNEAQLEEINRIKPNRLTKE